MNKQIIFCLETNKQAGTDWVYISETIKRFYKDSNKIHLEKEFLNGKTNYNSKGILNDISKKAREYRVGETRVVYCVDIDDFDTNQDHVREFEAIQMFCQQNGFDLIWFCHDVEDVFWGKRIHKSEKAKSASAFRKKKCINFLDIKKLKSTNSHEVHTSNILLVLNKHLEPME